MESKDFFKIVKSLTAEAADMHWFANVSTAQSRRLHNGHPFSRPYMNVMESTCSSESRITEESDYIGGLSCEKITRTHSLRGSLYRTCETAASSSDMRLCRAATCKMVVELAGENRKERLLERHRRLFAPCRYDGARGGRWDQCNVSCGVLHTRVAAA